MRFHARTWSGLAVAVMVISAVYYWSLPAYPKCSPRAYQVATALYSACNRRAPEQLNTLEGFLEDAHAAGQISDRERQWLGEMIGQARKEQWQEAAVECHTMMECQVDKDVTPVALAD